MKLTYQLRRFIVFNAITMPVMTVIYIPYNLYVLNFTLYQVKIWLFTGVIYGAFVAFIMTWVNIYATHFVDRHVQLDRDKEKYQKKYL